MRKVLLFISLLALPMLAQVQDTTKAYDYPYSMPIWGQKAADRGIKLQKPFGFNINYVFNQMELGIDNFGMTVGDDPNSGINEIIAEYITLETLNFKKTEAITNGMNVRADVWVLPVLNLYALYSINSGSTGVTLQPRWFDENGNLVLALPEFTSTVEFNANSIGVGATAVYGIDDYFVSVDANYTQSYSEILKDPAQFVVASARVGHRMRFKSDIKMAVYVGGMWRGFVESEGNLGQITLDQAFPEIGGRVFPEIDRRIEYNNALIAELDPNKPADKIQIEILETKNQALTDIGTGLENLIATDINYNIKKDIINNWSVQFGFNLELSDDWTVRGEYGKGTGNSFVLTGIQYRFGL